MMKKLLVINTFILISLFILSQAAEAQSVSAGGGVGYGSKSEDLNFSVNVYHRLSTLPMRIGGDVGYTRPKTSGDDRADLIDGNFNLHFLAVDHELVTLYTITGLNVLHSRFKTELDDQSITENNTDLGFNVGAGGELDLGNTGRVFGEVKYILGSEREDQLILGAGVRVDL